MEQLSLLEPSPCNHDAAVWNTLDHKQRTEIVTILERLIVQLAIAARAEREHQHE